MEKNPDRYYDSLIEKNKEKSRGFVMLHYVMSVVSFLVFIIIALGAYWIWEDYSAAGPAGITRQSFKGRVIYRWHEFEQGRLGI